MTSDVKLCRATLADLPQLSAYMQGLRRDDPMPESTVASENESVIAMRRLIEKESLGRVWLIRNGESSVGYTALAFVHSIEFGGRCAFVDELYVAPEFRGRGVGRRTLELVTQESRTLGLRTLLLEVSPENQRARRLYESIGFGPRKYTLMVQRL